MPEYDCLVGILIRIRRAKGQEQSNIGTVLTTIVRHSENLDYIVPMPVSEDIKEIDSEEWIRLIQKIIEESPALLMPRSQ